MSGKVHFPLTLKLKFPIKHTDGEISEINYRRPIAKDMRSIRPDKMDFGDCLNMFAKMSDQSDPIIDLLDGEDAIAAVQIVSNFLGGGQKTES